MDAQSAMLLMAVSLNLQNGSVVHLDAVALAWCLVAFIGFGAVATRLASGATSHLQELRQNFHTKGLAQKKLLRKVAKLWIFVLGVTFAFQYCQEDTFNASSIVATIIIQFVLTVIFCSVFIFLIYRLVRKPKEQG